MGSGRRGWWLGLWLRLLFGVGRAWDRDSNVDLKFLDLLVDKVESGCNDGIGDLNAFQGENAEFQFVQCTWGGVLQCLDLE